MDNIATSEAQEATWGGMPPAVKCLAKKDFIILAHLHSTLLPDPKISLKQLADFGLPALSAKVPENMELFTHAEPSRITADSLKQFLSCNSCPSPMKPPFDVLLQRAKRHGLLAHCYDNARIFHFFLTFIYHVYYYSRSHDRCVFISHMTHYESFLGLYFPHDSPYDSS
jgi:hypothetical protein